MKKIGLLFLVTAMVPIFTPTAKAAEGTDIAIARTAQGVDFTQSIDLSHWDRFSAQAVYSDGTPASHTITDGIKSTATVTVGTPSSGFIGAQASVQVNVLSTTSLSGVSITLNGILFKAGTDFSVGATTSTTATNLQARIDAHPDFVATVTGATVTVKYVAYGNSGNGLAVASSDAAKLHASASTFTGGIARYTLIINGVTLTEGVDFNADTLKSTTTAVNIKNAINANAILATQVSASTPSATVAQVNIVDLYPGNHNYYIVASTTGWTTTGFSQGADSDINTQTDTITKTNHALTTGLAVLFGTAGGSSITGLSNQTTYYAIKLNENQYQLATTTTNAVAGTAIDISAPLGVGSYTITPCPLTTQGGNGFYWSVSNDNANFTNLTGVSVNGISVSSVTYSSANNSVWDFGALDYKYLRLNYKAPTRGGLAITITVYGRKE